MGTPLLIQWIRIHLLMQGHGFSSWSRKIPHAMGQLSPCTPTTEPMGCNAWSLSSTARKQPLLVAMLTPVLPTKMKWKSHSWAGLSATPWTAARQAPLSMGLSRQGYWSGLPCPPPGDLPDPGIEPLSSASPSLQADSLLLSHRGKPYFYACWPSFQNCHFGLLGHWLLHPTICLYWIGQQCWGIKALQEETPSATAGNLWKYPGSISGQGNAETD